MRVDIDNQDILNVLADTKKRFDRAKIGLIVSLSITMVMVVAGGFGAVRAFEANQYIALGGFAALCAGALALAFFIVKARRKRARAIKEEAIANSLGAGRYDYIMNDEALTISGPLSVHKVCWANIARIERRKSSIVFYRKDGTFEFIPRNSIKDENTIDVLMTRHAQSLNKACPYEEANHQGPLHITYETRPDDLDAWHAHYFKSRDGWLAPVRQLCQWRPWTPFLFLTLLVIGLASGYKAFETYSLIYALTAIGFVAAAGVMFILNAAYFRGPAHPFRKNGAWPYAQSDMVSISLSTSGVILTRHGAADIIKWPAFASYVETKLFGYLVISPKQVITLPKRAFLDKAHFEDFTRYAKRSIADVRKQRNEEQQERMKRSLDKPPAPKVEPKAAPKPAASTGESLPGPSPKAAPAQVKSEKPQMARITARPAKKTPPPSSFKTPADATSAMDPSDAALQDIAEALEIAEFDVNEEAAAQTIAAALRQAKKEPEEQTIAEALRQAEEAAKALAEAHDAAMPLEDKGLKEKLAAEKQNAPKVRAFEVAMLLSQRQKSNAAE